MADMNTAALAAFAFVIPFNDTGRSVVDVSALNRAPLDASRRISIRDGRFLDATGRRVRFLGVDVAAGSCFPPKEAADGIAARMRRFGVNAVRLHHMDASWADPNLFHLHGGSYGKTTDELDAGSLDLLDWFVFQLKRHGIYVDVNLHVSRAYTREEGFEEGDKLPDLGKVVGYFLPKAIEQQRRFARQLLTHVNPYLGARLGDDPVVAFVELTNEDSLLGSAGEAMALPAPYRDVLAGGWNAWLAKKYGSGRAMLAAWNRGATPLGENLLANARMESGTAEWLLEQHASAKASIGIVDPAPGPGVPRGKVLRVSGIALDDTGWHLQLNRAGLTVKEGQRYTVSFSARADSSRSVGVNARFDIEPWTNIGLDTGVALGPEWRRYTLSFVARSPRAGHTRVTWSFGDSNVAFELGDVSLCPGGGRVELEPRESLERGTVAMPGVSGTPPGVDFTAFLIDVERDFTQGMRAFLRDELKVTAPVLCSQASYGGAGGAWRESRLDLIDMHAYWQHPSFPNKPWDSDDYRIGNTPMSAEEGGGTFPGLAQYRVAGMPFTVSEYDHPAPNEYAAESVPMLFSYAAWQDWDGVFLFCYSGEDLKRDRIDSFFDVGGHPALMAFLPAAARMFLAGAVPPAPASQTLEVPEDRVPALAAEGGWTFWDNVIPGSWSASRMIERRTAIRFVPPGTPPRLDQAEGIPSENRIEWSVSPASRAAYTVDVPSVKAAAGRLGGRTVNLGGVEVSIEPSPRNFAAFALAAMDGAPVPESGSLLLTVMDKVENPGLEWNADRTYAGRSWENGPTQVWQVKGRIVIPTKAKKAEVYRLDGGGRRAGQVRSTLAKGRLSFGFAPADRTVWYEIAVRP